MCLCHERALSGGATRNESGTGERAIARSAWKGYRQEAAHYKSHYHLLFARSVCNFLRVQKSSATSMPRPHTPPEQRPEPRAGPRQGAWYTFHRHWLATGVASMAKGGRPRLHLLAAAPPDRSPTRRPDAS